MELTQLLRRLYFGYIKRVNPDKRCPKCGHRKGHIKYAAEPIYQQVDREPEPRLTGYKEAINHHCDVCQFEFSEPVVIPGFKA